MLSGAGTGQMMTYWVEICKYLHRDKPDYFCRVEILFSVQLESYQYIGREQPDCGVELCHPLCIDRSGEMYRMDCGRVVCGVTGCGDLCVFDYFYAAGKL